jgi:biotin-dependent carboxylase-like uncharacterized protein
VRALALLRAGIASTVQDTGRPGRLQEGIPPAGAMDWLALKSGQFRLGHREDEAALEFAYGELQARPTHECTIVVTGAPVNLSIDGEPVDPETVHTVPPGGLIAASASTSGVYSYLHVGGGIDTTPCLGSRSTSPREGIGGLNGGYLRNGDTLPLGDQNQPEVAADPGLIRARERDVLLLRFVPGFQFGALPSHTQRSLQEQTFWVTSKGNRMGITMKGLPLKTKIQTLLSEATCQGAIQIPADGNPIVLLNDRQTVGGYPKAGAVITGDCQRLAQSRPGQRVRFAEISLEEADSVRWLEHHYTETKLQLGQR